MAGEQIKKESKEIIPKCLSQFHPQQLDALCSVAQGMMMRFDEWSVLKQLYHTAISEAALVYSRYEPWNSISEDKQRERVTAIITRPPYDQEIADVSESLKESFIDGYLNTVADMHQDTGYDERLLNDAESMRYISNLASKAANDMLTACFDRAFLEFEKEKPLLQ